MKIVVCVWRVCKSQVKFKIIDNPIIVLAVQVHLRTFPQSRHISLKGRSGISMVWVPPLGFHQYCKGKWLPLQDEFTPSINSKKIFYKSYKRILKNQKIEFSRKRLNRS